MVKVCDTVPGLSAAIPGPYLPIRQIFDPDLHILPTKIVTIKGSFQIQPEND